MIWCLWIKHSRYYMKYGVIILTVITHFNSVFNSHSTLSSQLTSWFSLTLVLCAGVWWRWQWCYTSTATPGRHRGSAGQSQQVLCGWNLRWINLRADVVHRELRSALLQVPHMLVCCRKAELLMPNISLGKTGKSVARRESIKDLSFLHALYKVCLMSIHRSLLGSSRISSQSTIESLNEEIEDVLFKRELPISLPGSHPTHSFIWVFVANVIPCVF